MQYSWEEGHALYLVGSEGYECMKESYSSTRVNNTDDIYKQVKTYLTTKQQLKQLECILKKESHQMHANNEEIKRLADDIRKQAEAALVT
ncbi:hypothetical protein ALC62_11140 [Cyphomyrmex costatus]|uniref:Uncharacterized protein n=1 Tax=Cyphomyrmex costatus TaxID=456900 RepID=A0A195CBB0_9HYME|nr:hypothetical protein ALC62_11140 [Cyphomyrmex costatus]